MERSNEPVCIRDFEIHAERNIDPNLYSYYKTGATDEFTLGENERAFKRFLFLPKMLRDVSKRNLKCYLQGSEIEHPFGIAPTAIHKIAHKDGELATAQAAGHTGTPMILSTLSSVSLEEVANCYLKHYKGKEKAPLWFQLYVFKDQNLTRSLIKRAESSGYTAIVVTIDTPMSGIRYENLRYRVALPADTKFANLSDYNEYSDNPEGNFFKTLSRLLDSSLTWEKIMTFLRSTTTLPIILKGVLTVEDAKLAVEYGADGIVVSNHGARQLDSVPSTIECLSMISQHLPAGFELYMDGGVRSGGDLLKALALGAKTIFLGRPTLWALSYGGTEGIVKMINILREELDTSMALSGVTDVNNVPGDLIMRSQL